MWRANQNVGGGAKKGRENAKNRWAWSQFFKKFSCGGRPCAGGGPARTAALRGQRSCADGGPARAAVLADGPFLTTPQITYNYLTLVNKYYNKSTIAFEHIYTFTTLNNTNIYNAKQQKFNNQKQLLF